MFKEIAVQDKLDWEGWQETIFPTVRLRYVPGEAIWILEGEMRHVYKARDALEEMWGWLDFKYR